MTQQMLPISSPPSKILKVTEATVLRLLKDKHTRNGNGGSGEFGFFEQVRDAGGFEASITIDAIALDLWPSRGYELHGFEVKISRSDWRRELAQPHKADAACKVVDRFTVVAPRGVVLDGELPELWGLIEVVEGKAGDAVVPKLRTVKAAPLLDPGHTKRRPIKRAFLVGLIRSCPGAIPGGKLDPDRLAIEAARAEGRETGLAQGKAEREIVARRLEEAEETMRTFEREAGVSITRWMGAWNGAASREEHVRTVAAAVKAALADEEHVRQAQRRLARTAEELRRQANEIDAILGKVGEELDTMVPGRLR